MKRGCLAYFLCLCMFTLATAQAAENNQADLSLSAEKEYRIAGGEAVEGDEYSWVARDEYSWVAAIYFLEKWDPDQRADAKFICAGSLINQSWVITSAKCLAEIHPITGKPLYQTPRNICVVLNINDLGVESIYDEEILGKTVILHPKIELSSTSRRCDPVLGCIEIATPDIALIELDKNARVKPMPIYTGSHNLEDIYGIVLGWDAASSEKLYKFELPILSHTNCSSAMNMYRDNEILPWEMCVGDPGGFMNTCYGYIGGPLIIQVGGELRLAGVMSSDNVCGVPGGYGIYNRVNHFVNFINKHIPPDISQLYYGHDDDFDFNCFISNIIKTSR